MGERAPRPKSPEELAREEQARGKELIRYTGPTYLDEVSELLNPPQLVVEKTQEGVMPTRRGLPEIVSPSPDLEASVKTPRRKELPEMHEPIDPAELTLTVVDQSFDARAVARDVATERLTRELNEGNIVRRVLKGVWKGGIARGYYREKYTREAQAKIIEAGDIHYFEDDLERSAQAKLATIERFQSEYEEAIHWDAGEERGKASKELTAQLKELIRRNVEGELSDEAMIEEKNRIFADLYANSKERNRNEKELVQIDNLTDIAAAVKSAIEHGESIDMVLEKIKVNLGESRSGVRTETNRNKLDTVLEKYERSKLSLIPPEFIAGAVSTAMYLTRTATSKAVVIPGVAGAVFAGLRESRIVKDERAQHMRDMARGEVFEHGAKRRGEMHETTYHMESAESLIRSLNEASSNEEALSSPEGLRGALEALGVVETRISLSDSDKVDLIAYSPDRSVEAQRLDLDIARARLKCAVKKQLTPELRSQLKIGENDSFEQIIAEYSNDITEAIEGDRSDKDRAFRALRRRRALGATAKGAAIGLTLGLAGQEIAAAVDASRQGLVEQLWDHGQVPHDGAMNQTLLEGVAHRVRGLGDFESSHVEHIPGATEYTTVPLMGHDSLKLPNDLRLDNKGAGAFGILDAKGNTIVDHIEFDESGNIAPASLAALNEHGVSLSHTQVPIEGAPREVTRQLSDKEFIRYHKNLGGTTHIKRDFWYDNNTSGRFERNELGLDWTGKGVDSDGSVHMNVASMTAGGSSHGGAAADWLKESREGDLKLAVSASKGTQSEVFMVNVRSNGQVDIPPGHPAAKLFTNENGRPVFRGGYVEVVETTNTVKGVTHVRPLATITGQNDFSGRGAEKIADTVKVPTHSVANQYTIESHGYEYRAPESMPTTVEMPPVIPVVSRRAMENLSDRQDSEGPEVIDQQSTGATGSDAEQIPRAQIDTVGLGEMANSLPQEETSNPESPSEPRVRIDTKDIQEQLERAKQGQATQEDVASTGSELASAKTEQNVTQQKLAEIFMRLGHMPTREAAAQDVKSALRGHANDAEVNGLFNELAAMTNYEQNEPKQYGDLSGLLRLPPEAESYQRLTPLSRRILTMYMQARTRHDTYVGRHRRP